MNPELFDVTAVLNNRTEIHPISGAIEIDEFVVGDEVFKPLSPAQYSLDLSYVGEGILASGSIDFEVQATCVRCLVEFPLVIHADVDILFYNQPTLDDDGDPLPHIDDEGRIALIDELIQSLIVEAPFCPVHDPECKGLCAKCGCDLNESACGCADEIDMSNPFALL